MTIYYISLKIQKKRNISVNNINVSKLDNFFTSKRSCILKSDIQIICLFHSGQKIVTLEQ
jgi:hypothetical protein